MRTALGVPSYGILKSSGIYSAARYLVEVLRTYEHLPLALIIALTGSSNSNIFRSQREMLYISIRRKSLRLNSDGSRQHGSRP